MDRITNSFRLSVSLGNLIERVENDVGKIVNNGVNLSVKPLVFRAHLNSKRLNSSNSLTHGTGSLGITSAVDRWSVEGHCMRVL